MKIGDKVNVILGAVVSLLSAIFGKYWFLFFGFLLCNVIDFVTGCIKAKIKNQESSVVGAVGIMKKVMYWLVIGLAFFISNSFEQLGETIGINLSFLVLFGWFTLASYLVNEIRSILENLVEMGVKVPSWLVKGLAVVSNLVDKKADAEVDNRAKKEEGSNEQ